MVKRNYPVGIYLFKVNNRNTRTRCKICSKLTIRTPERVFLVFLLLTLSREMPTGYLAQKKNCFIQLYFHLENYLRELPPWQTAVLRRIIPTPVYHFKEYTDLLCAFYKQQVHRVLILKVRSQV